MGIIAWIVVGLVAGWLASLMMRGGGYGLVGDIIVGIVGAVIGGFLAGAFLNMPNAVNGINIISILVALVGAGDPDRHPAFCITVAKLNQRNTLNLRSRICYFTSLEEYMSNNTQKARGTDKDAVDNFKDAVHDAKNETKDTVHDVKNKVEDAAHDAKKRCQGHRS